MYRNNVMGESRSQAKWSRWLVALLAITSIALIAGWYCRHGFGTEMTLEQLRIASAANNWSVVRFGGERYVRRHPENAEAVVLLAQAESAERRYDRALTLLAKVPAHSPHSPEARLREGQAWRQLFRGAAAERCFRQAIDEGLVAGAPQRVIDAARLGLVQLFAIERRTDEARKLIWELYRVSPQPVAVLQLLGQLDIEGAEPHEASQELQKFIANDPSDFDARIGLAHHYLVLGRAREGRQLAERCLEARGESLAAWDALLGCLSDLGDNTALGESILRVPRTAHETAWYCKYQGMAAEHIEQWETAERAFRQAIRHDPYDSAAHHRLGRLLHQLGKSLEADEHLAHGRRLTAIRGRLREVYRTVLLANQQGMPLSIELCADMGECYEGAGLSDGAAAWYRETLKRNPADPRGREGLLRVQAGTEMDSAPIGNDDANHASGRFQP